MPVSRSIFRSLIPIVGLCALSTIPGTSLAQQTPDSQSAKPQEGGQPPASGGVNTGGAHAAVLDKEHRPITAGGFVKTGPIVFQDIAAKAGLTSWTPHDGHAREDTSSSRPSAPASACSTTTTTAGSTSISSTAPPTTRSAGKATRPNAALFHNNHDGTFTDVAAKAGVTNDRWGIGVAIADYDNDGWPDIYVSNFGKNRLYHNNHDGTFTDVAEKAGVTLGNWSTGATWGDYDGDGRLDLFVPGYVHYDMANQP